MNRVGTSRSSAPRPCPRCGHADSRIALAGPDRALRLPGCFYVGRCSACGLLFQNPAPDPTTLAAHYPDEYGPYAPKTMELTRAQRWDLKHRRGYEHLEAAPSVSLLRRWWGGWATCLDLIPDYVSDGRSLEIGCASGAQLTLMRELGWAHCTGIELHAFAAEQARRRGFCVLTGRVEDVLDEIEPGSQDVVLARYVIEHLEDPFAVTARIASKLRPGGQLCLSTLHVGSLDRVLFGRYWYGWDLPRHFTWFRLDDLRSMLAPYFRVERVAFRVSPRDFLGSARYRRQEQPRRLDTLLPCVGGKLWRALIVLALAGRTTRVSMHARKL